MDFFYHNTHTKASVPDFDSVTIEQGSAHLFCKGLDSKCFRISWACGRCHSYPILHRGAKAVIDYTYVKRCICVSINFYLQKQVVAWIRPISHSFLTPVLKQVLKPVIFKNSTSDSNAQQKYWENTKLEHHFPGAPGWRSS